MITQELEKLATVLQGKTWTKNGMQRIYLNDKNTYINFKEDNKYTINTKNGDEILQQHQENISKMILCFFGTIKGV